MVLKRKYKKSCDCGNTRLVSGAELQEVLAYQSPSFDAFHDISNGVWSSLEKRLSSGYPASKQRKRYSLGVRRCHSCNSEVGFTSSGKPYTKSLEKESKDNEIFAPIIEDKDYTPKEFEWFED